MPNYQYKCPEHGVFIVDRKISDNNKDSYSCPINGCGVESPINYNYGPGNGPLGFSKNANLPSQAIPSGETLEIKIHEINCPQHKDGEPPCLKVIYGQLIPNYREEVIN